MVDRSKAVVSRSALERVLARAAELQAASADDDAPSESLTEAQIEELGKEVGLSAQYIRHALAEERARIVPSQAEAEGSQLFGIGLSETQRLVRGRPDRILTALDRWMQKEEGLKVKRQRADIITWEPMRGVFGSLRRMLGTGDFALTRADEVRATVVAVDDEFTLVRLQASFASLRSSTRNRIIAGTAFGGAISGGLVIVASVIPLAVAVVPLAVVPVVVAGGSAYYLARQSHQSSVQRAHLALEQVLDRLERGDAERPSLLRMIESALPPSR